MNHDHDFESMSVDQLWSLHKMIATELARKMTAEKERLDQRLRELRLKHMDLLLRRGKCRLISCEIGRALARLGICFL